MAEFDPYLKWLGIREASRPINFYRLLGLDLFESDSEVISMAADRQMSHIRTYQNGPNGKLSQDILNEIAAARRCLIMPQQKLAYDQELRASQKAAPKVAPQAAIDEDDIEVVVPIVTSSRRKKTPIATPIVTPVVKSRSSELRKDLSPPSRQLRPNSSSSPGLLSESPQFHFDTTVPNRDVEDIAGSQAVRTGADGSDQAMRAQRKNRERTQLLWTLFAWVTGGLAAVGVSAILINSGWLPNSQIGQDTETFSAGNDETDNSENLAAELATANNRSPQNTQPVSRVPAKHPQPDSRQPTSNEPVVNPSIAVPTPEQIHSGDFEWNVAQLNSYPLPADEALTLISKANAAVRKKQIEERGVSSNRIDGQAFNVIPDDGGILIVFVVSKTDSNQIKTLQPIYLNRDGVKLGRQIGKATNATQVLIAKPGFAVGVIEMSTADTPSYIKLTFMKIADNQLDKFDTYRTKPVGQLIAPSTKIINPDGQPIVGTYGSYIQGRRVTSMGLICANVRRLVNTPLAGMPKLKDPDAEPNEAEKTEIDPDESPFKVLNPGEAKRNGAAGKGLAAALDRALEPERPKLALPSTAEKKKAERQLLHLYLRKASKVNSLRKSKTFSTTLIRDAGKAEFEPTERFVILDAAIRCSCRFGDAETALAGIRELDSSFEIDYWRVIREMLSAADDNTNEDNGDDFQITLDSLIDEAIEEEEYEEANWMISRGMTIAKRSRKFSAATRYEEKRKQYLEYERLSDANEEAVIALALNPQDQSASQACGNFQFVVRDDFDGTMDYWKNSSNEIFRQVAEGEAKLDKKQGAKILEIANLWETAGARNRSLLEAKCLRRAIELNQLARSKFDGLKRKSIDKKIRELTEMVED